MKWADVRKIKSPGRCFDKAARAGFAIEGAVYLFITTN
jgi:hypothetical protein